MTQRICLDCPKPISRESTGRCRACACRELVKRPGLVADRNAKTAETRRDPLVRERVSKAVRAGKRRAAEQPGVRERRQELGRIHGAANFWRNGDADAQAAGRESIRRQKLAWCPEQHWPLNASLKSKGLTLAERQEVIGKMVADAEAARLAAMSPFERQAERLSKGGRIVAAFTPTSTDHAFTLGGVATGIIGQ